MEKYSPVRIMKNKNRTIHHRYPDKGLLPAQPTPPYALLPFSGMFPLQLGQAWFFLGVGRKAPGKVLGGTWVLCLPERSWPGLFCLHPEVSPACSSPPSRHLAHCNCTYFCIREKPMMLWAHNPVHLWKVLPVASTLTPLKFWYCLSLCFCILWGNFPL
uniref:Uncharacterized protein n=1 Tax=Myotis myotis TaxID=51298 RepID=A0A7J7R216_MYOMY|nr:hypothetical protein mMyoMyo1_011204 [Myotis myotis]